MSHNLLCKCGVAKCLKGPYVCLSLQNCHSNVYKYNVPKKFALEIRQSKKASLEIWTQYKVIGSLDPVTGRRA